MNPWLISCLQIKGVQQVFPLWCVFCDRHLRWCLGCQEDARIGLTSFGSSKCFWAEVLAETRSIVFLCFSLIEGRVNQSFLSRHLFFPFPPIEKYASLLRNIQFFSPKHWFVLRKVLLGIHCSKVIQFGPCYDTLRLFWIPFAFFHAHQNFSVRWLFLHLLPRVPRGNLDSWWRPVRFLLVAFDFELCSGCKHEWAVGMRTSNATGKRIGHVKCVELPSCSHIHVFVFVSWSVSFSAGSIRSDQCSSSITPPTTSTFTTTLTETLTTLITRMLPTTTTTLASSTISSSVNTTSGLPSLPNSTSTVNSTSGTTNVTVNVTANVTSSESSSDMRKPSEATNSEVCFSAGWRVTIAYNTCGRPAFVRESKPSSNSLHFVWLMFEASWLWPRDRAPSLELSLFEKDRYSAWLGSFRGEN